MSTTEHADFEALSAYVDGEAPEWADHVTACPGCRATAAELRALSAKVAAPADPPPAAQRDAAIAAALGVAVVGTGESAGVIGSPEPTAAARHEAQRARFGRRAGSPSWAMPAVAAVVLALLGLSGVILSANRSTNEDATTLAGPALDSTAESVVPGAPTAPPGDLGDVPDAATLRARALGVGAASGASSSPVRSSSSPSSGAESDTQSTANTTNTGNTGAAILNSPPTPVAGGSGGVAAGGPAAVVAPSVVGTRPCEERARSREPGLGPVTYFATARRGAVPAYVLGFSAGGGGQVTLLMLAQDDCSELLRSAGP